MKSYMKRFTAFFLAVALLVLVLPYSVSAATGNDAADALLDAGIVKDENFALALAEAGVTVDNYATFSGEIDASNRGIKSIEGINHLVSAQEIDLSKNLINDITPIMNPDGGLYAAIFDLTNNPINTYFPSIQQELYVYASTNRNAGSVATNQDFRSDLNILYDGSPKTVKVYFGATVGGEYRWNTLDGVATYPYIVGNTPDGVTFSYDEEADPTSEAASYASVIVEKNAEFRIRAYFEKYRFYVGWKGEPYAENPQNVANQQSQSPDFRYDVNIRYFVPVSTDVTADVVGGFKVTKTDSEGSPLDGAVITVYSDEACTERVATSTTKDGVAVFSGLADGTYYVKETSAPLGYEVSEEVMSVTLSNSVATVNELAGGDKIGSLITGNDIAIEPDWDSWDRSLYDQPMKLKSGTVTEVSEDKIYVSNGGEHLTTLNVGAADASDLTVVKSDLTLTVGNHTFTVKDSAEALAKINEMIDNGTIDGEVKLTGSISYAAKEADYENLVITDTSLCVFIKPAADKKLVGRAIKEGEFGFEFTGEDCAGDVKFSGVNAAAEAGEDTTVVNFVNENDGDVILRFCKVGEYNFVLKEVIPENKEEGMRYDDTEYKVTVTVTESGEKGLKAVLKVNGKEVLTTYSSETTDEENAPSATLATTKLCTITNTFTERENPKTGVPTVFSVLNLFYVAGAAALLKRKFF